MLIKLLVLGGSILAFGGRGASANIFLRARGFFLSAPRSHNRNRQRFPR